MHRRRQERTPLSDALAFDAWLTPSIKKPSCALNRPRLGDSMLPWRRACPRRQYILDDKGMPLAGSGRVNDNYGSPIAGATLDVWMMNEDGFYDIQQPEIQPEMNLRGIFDTNDDGRYWFRSARPRFYPIPKHWPGRAPSRLIGHATIPGQRTFISS